MGKQVFTNGASATLAVSIINTDVTIQVQSGYGVLFPAPTGGNWAMITLEDSSGNIEIVKCTARSGDLLTVTRAQEGTSAQSFTNTVTRVELRDTAGSMDRFVQRSGDTLGGDLNLGGFTLSNGALSTNVTVPNTSVFPVGLIAMWSGSAGSIPSGWHLCDGAAGTPDLRDRFVIGAGNTYAVGATGGATTDAATTTSDGAHDHGATGSHVLTEAEIPAHHHSIFAANSSSDTNADSWGKSGTRGIPGEDIGPFAFRATSNSGDQLISDTGGGTGHTHTTASGGAHTHDVTVDILPPYYALCFIMFTG